MDLLAALRAALDEALSGVGANDLARAAEALSKRYRAEVRDGQFHVDGDLAARAYLAARLPATYAAVRAALAHLARARPDFAPTSLLDAGAGPGTALWAAQDAWPGLMEAVLLEGSPAMRRWGERLAAGSGLDARWRSLDLVRGLPELEPSALVTLCYVLDELEPEARDGLIRGLWERTEDTLLIVEPGTPAGHARILAARSQLLAAGAQLIAPCPHHGPCPLSPPDWCHFSARLPRSKLHRQTKGAELGWEDEKYSYVAASRRPAARRYDRVLSPPHSRSGLVSLRLCSTEGRAETRQLSKRDGETFKRARRLDWGDAL